MSQTLQERISSALGTVINPRTGANVVSSEMVKDVGATLDGKVRLTIVLDAGDDATLVRDVRQAVERVSGVTAVSIDVKDPREMSRPQARGAAARALAKYGHRDVHILAGGHPRWIAEGGSVARDQVRHKPASFTAFLPRSAR